MEAARIQRNVERAPPEGEREHVGHSERRVDSRSLGPGARGRDRTRSDVHARGPEPFAAEPEHIAAGSAPDVEHLTPERNPVILDRIHQPGRWSG